MFNFVYFIQCETFDSHLDYSQQSSHKGESLVFFFSYDIFHFRYMSDPDPFFVMVMRSVTSVTPFCYDYDYAVNHSESSALIPLMGYFLIWVIYITYISYLSYFQKP